MYHSHCKRLTVNVSEFRYIRNAKKSLVLMVTKPFMILKVSRGLLLVITAKRAIS